MRKIFFTLLLLVFIPGAHAQVNSEKYRNLFLVGEFGEVCTMCEVIVLCEAGKEIPAHDVIPAGGNFTLYHLQTRTFWSQIATIWEWFVANFNAETLAPGHSRPVHVYVVTAGNWQSFTTIDAQIALEPPLLSLGDHLIDRSNQAWLSAADSAALGYCQRMPLWESLEIIGQQDYTGVPNNTRAEAQP